MCDVCVKKLNTKQKFAPTYASIFMDDIKTNFLDMLLCF